MAVSIVNDDFMACADCTSAIANDDYTSLDYYYDEQEAEKRMIEIREGMAKAGGHICVGDHDNDLEFSRRPCDCCGSDLYGARVHFVVLKG